EVKFSVPWGHIAAKIYGSPKEKKVLMVHGILDNAGSFDRLIKFLPQSYQYVNIDLPGHGLSSPFPRGIPLHFFDYVYSILLVLNALEWKTCIYIGHSFGAQIGTYFSMIYPGRCEKLIALDGFLPFLVEDIIPFIKNLYNLDNYAKDSGTLYTKDEVIHALKFKRRETLTEDAAEALFIRAVTKVNNLYKYNRDARLRYVVRPIFTLEQHKEIFSKYLTETLIIMADSSFQANFLSEKLKTLLNRHDESKFSVVIVRGNHDVHNNYPERVAPYVCQFLDS
ncbi:Serine hydrolase-like protein, partial [Eufriesea mexicana]